MRKHLRLIEVFKQRVEDFPLGSRKRGQMSPEVAFQSWDSICECKGLACVREKRRAVPGRSVFSPQASVWPSPPNWGLKQDQETRRTLQQFCVLLGQRWSFSKQGGCYRKSVEIHQRNSHIGCVKILSLHQSTCTVTDGLAGEHEWSVNKVKFMKFNIIKLLSKHSPYL